MASSLSTACLTGSLLASRGRHWQGWKGGGVLEVKLGGDAGDPAVLEPPRGSDC